MEPFSGHSVYIFKVYSSLVRAVNQSLTRMAESRMRIAVGTVSACYWY